MDNKNKSYKKTKKKNNTNRNNNYKNKTNKNKNNIKKNVPKKVEKKPIEPAKEPKKINEQKKEEVTKTKPIPISVIEKETSKKITEKSSKNDTIPKKKKKRRKLRKIPCLIFIVSLALFIYAICNIFIWGKDSKKTEQILEEINEITEIVEVEDNENTIVIEPEEVEDLPKFNPYWSYIKMNLIDVDINVLKEINMDTVGWIQVQGTKVNYPFVQTSNNEYYLKHSFDKKYNVAGWVFLDYRNNLTENKNTILYAHSMENDLMFGTLKNTLKDNWVNNKNNHVIKISTETENTLWQVFSIYIIPTTSDYLQTDFVSDDEYKVFVDKMLKRSQVYFDTTVSEKDHILTLSTCSGKEDKLVIHAKLIKKEAKK